MWDESLSGAVMDPSESVIFQTFGVVDLLVNYSTTKGEIRANDVMVFARDPERFSEDQWELFERWIMTRFGLKDLASVHVEQGMMPPAGTEATS